MNTPKWSSGTQWVIDSTGVLWFAISEDYHYDDNGYCSADFRGIKNTKNPNGEVLAKVLSKVMKLSSEELKVLCEENVDWFL